MIGFLNRGRVTIPNFVIGCDVDTIAWALRTIPSEHAMLTD